MGRGGTARPPEAEWSSGVAAFLGGCYIQDIFKDPKKRHYHDVGVLYNKVMLRSALTCVLLQHSSSTAVCGNTATSLVCPSTPACVLHVELITPPILHM